MATLKGTWGAAAAAAWAVLLAGSGSAAAADAAAVRECVRGNAPRVSLVQTLLLSVREPGSEVSVLRAKLYWRRLQSGEHRLLLRYLEPPELEGSALLVEAEPPGNPRVHLFLPELGQPRRVYTAAEVEGFLGPTDMGEELDWIAALGGGAELRLLDAPSEHEGRAVWAVELRREGSEKDRYERAVALIDREWCLPIHVAFFEAGDEPRKVLSVPAGEVSRKGEVWLPDVIDLEDRKLGSRASLRIESAEVDGPLAPGLLTVRGLAAGAR
jgi:Outer membrane lipoprotein-sorting protein